MQTDVQNVTCKCPFNFRAEFVTLIYSFIYFALLKNVTNDIFKSIYFHFFVDLCTTMHYIYDKFYCSLEFIYNNRHDLKINSENNCMCTLTLFHFYNQSLPSK